jgi:hypothetical protein
MKSAVIAKTSGTVQPGSSSFAQANAGAYFGIGWSTRMNAS